MSRLLLLNLLAFGCAFHQGDFALVKPGDSDLVLVKTEISHIAELGRRKDYRAPLLAAQFARHADVTSIITLCKQLEFESDPWKSAFFELRNRKRNDDTIKYLYEVSLINGSLGRFYSYQLCKLALWDDLLSLATRDLENDDVIVLPNVKGRPLSYYAIDYLRTLTCTPSVSVR